MSQESTIPNNDVKIVETITTGQRMWHDRPGAWHVLHVKPRQEKALLEQLGHANLSLYVPLWPQVRYYGKRKKKVELPLFPGYAFLKGERDDAIVADRTRRLVNILDVKDQDALAWELAGVEALLASGEPFSVHRGLAIGQKVVVRSGPMKGVQGMVESLEKADRLVLQIQTLGRAVSVEVDMSLVEPLSD